VDPRATAEIGRTGLRVTRLGLGTAPLAGLFHAVSEADARATVERAWDLGLRFFDSAPLYGSGMAEQRLGAVLRERPRDEFVLATKAGRLIRRGAPPEPGQDFIGRPEGMEPVFDFSGEGVRRSLEESLQRLGLERVDILHLHDPDDHYEQALTEGYPALAELRQQGAIRAVGAGMNQAAMEARFLRAAAFDCFLLAGRYTLLDQSGLDQLLPLASERRASIIAGGVFNSGLLAAADAPDATFDYAPAPEEMKRRARELADVCRNHGVALPVAAIQFPLGHPAVASVVVGARSAAELEEDVAMFSTPVPGSLWEELRRDGWIPVDAPVPA
jgi:D-threo-aldose 1-dehydrogenase